MTYSRMGALWACVLLCSAMAGAQTSGTVFRDLNGDGTRQSTVGTFQEPAVQGVYINVYNSSDVWVASFLSGADGTFSIPTSGTSFNGIEGSNTGFVASSQSIRLEFVIPSNSTDRGKISNVLDYASSGASVYGSQIRFITSGTSGNNFALNNPADFVFNTASASNTIYLALQQLGNSTASSGTSKDGIAFLKTTYNNNGTPTFTADEKLATMGQIGSVYGVAYSKKANKIFVAAYLKRHSGFGPANGNTNHAPGAIYIIDPTLSSSSTPAAASFFMSLDQLGYPTHNSTGSPAYGLNKSFTLSSNGLSGDELEHSISYIEKGWAVIGTNAQRGLPNDFTTASHDTAAFGQIGKLSLGDLDISDDGKYLFVTNLYDRRIYMIELNSDTTPTSASIVNSWELPNPPLRSQSGIPFASSTYKDEYDNTDFYTGDRGLQRPFALKYHRGKLFIGSVTTGEGANGSSIKDNNAGAPEYTDLWAYVWKLDVNQGFDQTPAIQFPLNFERSTNTDEVNETWNIWNQTLVAPTNKGINIVANQQPIFSDIEFDSEGAMVLSFRDRNGDQLAYNNYMLTGTEMRSAWVYGDSYRAYYNASTGAYEIERNGREGLNSSKPPTLGAFGLEGPFGGEFYFEDGMEKANGVPNTPRYHVNCGQGSLALLPGKNEVLVTQMDPINIWSGGVSTFDNTNGTNTVDLQVYEGDATGDIGKANGLGDLEIFAENAVIEIGNRVWSDSDADGIQDAGESGIQNVSVYLYSNGPDGIAGNADDVQVGSTTTNSTGNYYFTTASGTDGSGVDYGVNILPLMGYNVRIGNGDWNSGTGVGNGDLANKYLTTRNVSGNGLADHSDNDASLNGYNYPMISFVTGDYGQNNHSYDFGFSPPYATLGNRVWFDENSNGVFDEDASQGINGVTVQLYKETSSGSGIYTLNKSTLTTNDEFNNPGYYRFIITDTANFKVKFIHASGVAIIQNSAAATDNNSDPNPADGLTLAVAMNPGLTGIYRENMTIDAGFKLVEISNLVWMDADGDGVQDAGEGGIKGVVLELYDSIGNPVYVCKSETEATDFYSVEDNDGTINFGSSWVVSGTGSSIFEGELIISGQTGVAVRDVSRPSFFQVDSVQFSFELKQIGLSSSENFQVDYYNGSSWVSLDNITAAEITGDYQTFSYNSASVPGLLNIDSIRFREGSFANADLVYADNLNITFEKACAPARDTTDANGNYSFNLLKHNILPTTTYQIRISESQDSISHYITTLKGMGTSLTDNNGADSGSYISSVNIVSPYTGSDPSFDFGLIGYSVGNLIWWDSDNDGNKDASESGISNVELALLNSDGSLRETTTTDAEGKYLFSGLPAGSYQIAVTSSLSQGVLKGATIPTTTTTADTDNNNNGNAVNPNSNPATVTFSSISEVFVLASKAEPTNESDEDPMASQPDNQSNLTIDFGFYILTIGDKVWVDADADGVQDNNEEGIADIYVELCDNSGNLKYIGCSDDNVATDFSSTSHNSGSLNFNGSWSVSGGSTAVTSGVLRVYGNVGTATRAVNRPGSYAIDTVTVSFNAFQTGLDTTETILVEYNNGTEWKTLETLYGYAGIIGMLNTTTRSFSFSSVDYPGLVNITSIRFRENPSKGFGTSDYVTIDDLNISFAESCAPARVQTDANGNYYFNSAVHGLTASTNYKIRIAKDQDALLNYSITSTGMGTSTTDNNATLSGDYFITGTISSPANGSDFSFDFGFYPVLIGNYVWIDTDADGVQDVNERGIRGVELQLYRTNGVLYKYSCGPDSVATNFYYDNNNSGSLNFTGKWTSATAPSSLIQNERLVMTDLRDASRYFNPPAYDSISLVTVTYDVLEGAGIANTDGIRVQYYNGSSWQNLDTVLGTQINTSTFTTISVSSASISGVKDIRGIRFYEHAGLGASEYIYVDNLKIVFEGKCNAETETDESGLYLFGKGDGIQPGGQYQIRITETQDSLNGFVITTTGGGTSSNDNNGTDAGSYTTSGNISAPGVGQDLTFDFGYIGYSIGNLVWWDLDGDGQKDGGESGIEGVEVKLIDSRGQLFATTTTDVNGKYYFYGLPQGYYQVAIGSSLNSGVLLGATASTSNLVADTDNNSNGSTVDTAEITTEFFSVISEQVYLGGSAEPTNESDEDPKSGQADNMSNLSIDFGFYKLRIGNRVWLDGDADGIQDNDERGIGGVTLKLYDGTGSQIYNCEDRTIETNMSAAGHNGGDYNFSADWIFMGGGSLASGEMLISDLDSARRHFVRPTDYSYDSIVIRFDLKKNASLDASDVLSVQYHNGSSWTTLDDISGSEILSTSSFNTFVYNSISTPGLTSVSGIRFSEGSGISGTEIVYVDNLIIAFKKACTEISTETDADGYYYFSSASHYLTPSTTYQIRIAEAQDSLDGFTISLTGQGNSSTDNNGTDAGSYITSGNISSLASGDDLSFDFGFTGYSVGNLIWWDTDNDGTKDGDEIGIPGVQVALLDASGVLMYTTTTDANGKYHFHGLMSGDYQVAVTSNLNSGILAGAEIPATTTTADTDNNNNGSATNPEGSSATEVSFSSISEQFTLGSKNEPTNETDEDVKTNQPDNQSNLTIDFGFVPPQTAIGNLVFGDLNNNGIFDFGDTTVINIKVYLYKDMNGDFNPESIVDSTTTISGGLYQFINPGPGTYRVVIAPSNFNSGQMLNGATSTTHANSGDSLTDNNSEGTQSGIFRLQPNSQPTLDLSDDAIAGDFGVIIGDDDANFTFDFGFMGGAVPVSWLYFEANLDEAKRNGLLTWATASEKNNQYFEIQRSFDAENFEILGYVNSKAEGGNSQDVLKYGFVDQDIQALNKSIIYYRIRQVDFDGKYEYSATRAVYPGMLNQIQIYPNPVIENVHVNMTKSANSRVIRVLSATGQLLFENNIAVGVEKYELDMSSYSKGTYLIQIIDGNLMSQHKVIRR